MGRDAAMQITVFLASSLGTDPRMRAALEELAAWIGRAGHTLVYGGSRIGLMGVLAVTAKANGARVIGVEPRFFVEACRQFEGADELIVTDTMSERKDKLIAMADAVVVFHDDRHLVDKRFQAAVEHGDRLCRLSQDRIGKLNNSQTHR